MNPLNPLSLSLVLWIAFSHSAAAIGIDNLNAEVEELIKDSDVPSLAVAAIVDGKIRGAGAFGIRKKGASEKVTLEDRFHIGSCTKSMTATLAAILVEEGTIRWDTRPEELFPDVDIHRDYQAVTLEQLLSNTAGCPGDVPSRLWSRLWRAEGSLTEQRKQLVEGILSRAPEYEPGTQRVYSNAGFGIAGAMLETAAGESFEQLMRAKLFKPLGMSSAGFRAPATPGKVDQPYGHNPEPVDPEPRGDNPSAIAAAGGVHCSILDFARYAQLHLGSGFENVLSERQLEKLHQPAGPDDDYALGWMVTRRGWAKATALTHAGSNTMFYSVIWLAPNRDFAAVAVCNTGEEEGFEKCDAAVAMAIGKYLDKD